MTCVEWKKHRDPDGYGIRRWHGKTSRAHRVAWIETNGPIPEGMCVLHKCDNRACVNVDHLRLGTHQDNMKDRTERDQSASGERHPKAKLTIDNIRAIRQIITGKTWRGVI